MKSWKAFFRRVGTKSGQGCEAGHHLLHHRHGEDVIVNLTFWRGTNNFYGYALGSRN